MTDIEKIQELRNKFVMTCEFDNRLATPDYAKYSAFYQAFEIAERALAQVETQSAELLSARERIRALTEVLEPLIEDALQARDADNVNMLYGSEWIDGEPTDCESLRKAIAVLKGE